jgi:hypothetical protein
MESLEFNHDDGSPHQPMGRGPFLPAFCSDSVQRPSLCTKYLVSLDDPIREVEPYQVHANVNVRRCQDQHPGEDEILRAWLDSWLLLSRGHKATAPQRSRRIKTGPLTRDREQQQPGPMRRLGVQEWHVIGGQTVCRKQEGNAEHRVVWKVEGWPNRNAQRECDQSGCGAELSKYGNCCVSS